MGDELDEVMEGPKAPLPAPTLEDADAFMERTTRQVNGCIDFLEATLADIQEGHHVCGRSSPALNRLGLGLYGVATFYTGVVGTLFRDSIDGYPPELAKAAADQLIGASRIAAARQLDQLEETVRAQILERMRREAAQ